MTAEELAKDAGFCAALDNLPRDCPAEMLEYERPWLAGYDEGAARAAAADARLRRLVG